MTDGTMVKRGDTTVATATPLAVSSTWVQTTRGKGRVKPRQVQIERGDPAVLRVTRVSHKSAEQGEQEGDPKPRYFDSLACEWLQRIQLDHPTKTYKAMDLMRSEQPLVLRGTALIAKLASTWTLEHLADAMGTKHKTWRILCSKGTRHAFLEYDASKNIYGSEYHVREPETQRLEMGFWEFAQCARNWTTRKVFFKNTVMQQCKSGAVPAAVDEVGRGMKAELTSGVDWRWLQGLQQAQRFGRVARVDLEVGTTNGLLPARYEVHGRLLAQVQGRRRVLLISPSQAFTGMYPFPTHHTYDGYSMVDWEDLNRQQWSDASGAQGHVCILGPGELLYVPPFWFAHVQQLEAVTATLVFHMHQGARLRAKDCIPLQVSRLLEDRMAHAEGIQHVRHWLQLIAYQDEASYIDLATVKGYKRIVLAQEIRDEVDLNLGENAWHGLLVAMCNGRLLPTPWLNKDFREPMYLTDKPVRYEDTRSLEERQYPELFRHKLQSEGWSVPKHESTVPIPGYNMPMHADYRKM
ncbi:hypothetical protein WJX72_009229 [[Myrmecia] bisecta]|uniref:JmjC domain-containing protein n=1 Tax=[Myrmecia] bisecta TaxID=41462 RepID=A0AAW1PXY0_9CHLO